MMTLRKTLFTMLILALALTAVAEDKVARRMSPNDFGHRNSQLAGPAYTGRAVFEGFEGTFPPDGWVIETTNPACEWYTRDDGWGFEGTTSASTDWDAAPADEKLSFDALIDVAADEYVLSFWAAGSTGQTWDLNARETVEINGVEVWSFDDEVIYGHHFEFIHYFIDLSDYDGQTVTITFRYAGAGGDSHFIDAVMIDEGTGWLPPPPPPAPENDTCDGALEFGYTIPSGDFTLTANNTFANPDYALTGGSCSPHGFQGYDVVWAVCMDTGDNLDVSMTVEPFFDSIFFLVTDCSDPVNSCVAAGDEPEEINYTAPEDGIYYLICGGWQGNDAYVGDLTITGNFSGAGCDPVAVKSTSFTELKGLFR